MSKTREEALVKLALEIPAAARCAFLDRECQGDSVLRQRLERLLAVPGHPAEGQGTHATLGEDGPANGAREEGRTQFDPAMDEAVGQTLGRYKLLEQLGEGGCGVVYVAEQTEPVRRRVALKVIKLGMDTRQVIARFEAERQALAMMDHPNIAKVLDGGATQTGRPYFVMELVRGIKITDYCDQAQLSTRDRVELFIKVCQAIQHAHQKGIIHRDIKPSNTLVTLHDGVPVPKVIDFGIAKATEGRLTEATVYTQLSQFIGTPAYMSPEQAEMSGLDVDTRSDIYSLGVLLYELLTGRTPFDVGELMAQGLDAMRRTIREVEPARPSNRIATFQADELTTTAKRRSVDTGRLLHQLRGDLDWIVMKCLEKDRTRRYETASGLAADLRRHLNDEPVVARPPSKLYEFKKTVVRHRFGFAATAAIILALAGGLSLSTWQFLEKKQAYNLAVAAGLQQTRERLRAEKMSEESRERAVRLNTAYGVRLMESADLLSSLQWFVEALHLAEPDPARARVHRARIGAVLRQCPKLLQLWVHESPVNYMEFSPDGRWVLTAHVDGRAQVWDAATGGKIGLPLQHAQTVNWAAFSADSMRVVTASSDSTVRVWDAATGRPLAPPIVHPGKVSEVVFSPDGRKVLLGGDDGTARLWDAASSQPLTPPLRHTLAVEDVGFSPDGRRVITASADGTAQVWDASTGAAVGPPIRHEDFVVRASFSPDGRRVLTASRDGTARIWDASTSKPLTPPLRHSTWLTDARFNPDNTTVVTASFDNTACIWDAETGKPVCSPLRHGHSVMSSVFSPDGGQVITACFNQTAQVWDAATGELLLSPLKHSGYVSQALFSPDGRRALTGGYDGTMRLWEMSTHGSLLAAWDIDGAVCQMAFSGDGQRLATADTNGVVRFWDAATGQALAGSLSLTGAVQQLVFSPDGHRLLGVDSNATAHLFDTTSGQPTGRPMQLGASVDIAGFSPDARRVFLGAHAGLACVWDAATGEPTTPLLRITNATHLVSFNRDGSRIVAVDSDQFARVWDMSSGRPVSPPVKHPARVVRAEFSPDGLRVVTSCSDETLTKLSAKVWDVATGAQVGAALQHEDGVEFAAFSPDGRSIVTASEDGTAGIWDAETGLLRAPFLRHNYQVPSAVFSPDGRFIATASRDRTARVWDAATGEPVTPPLPHAAPAFFVVFNATADRLITRSRDGRAFLWDLTPDTRNVEELVQLGQLLNSRKVNASGGALPVDASTLAGLWQQFHIGSTGVSNARVETDGEWHDREAVDGEGRHRWFAAVFHLRRLLVLNPQDAGVKGRLARAEAALHQAEQDRSSERSGGGSDPTPRS